MSDTGSFGYGQQKPQDYADWSNVIEFIVRQRVAQINTVKVVQVIAVHPGAGSPMIAGTVDVLPLVNQIDGNGYAVQHRTVFGIPYFQLTAGPWAIIAEPAVNDLGLMLCADRDSSSVIRSGKQTTPASRRKFSMSDGFYLGGFLNQTSPQASFQLNGDGTLKVVDKQGNQLVSSSNGWALTGNVNITGALAVSGTVTGSGAINATGKITGSDFSDGTVTSYKAHTHGGVTTGAAVTGTPTPGS
jgi:hypothetical protein